MSLNAFTPIQGATQAIAATTTSQSITLSEAGKRANQLFISFGIFTTATGVHINTGVGSATATTSDMFINRLNSNVIISKSPGDDTIAVITDAVTCTVYITPGDGK